MQDQQGAKPPITVRGNSNLIVGRDLVQIVTERPKFTIVVQRDDGHISDVQAAALKRLVHEIVEITKASETPLTYSNVWSTLNREMKVPSYRLTPAAHFPRAEAMLVQWRAKLD